MHENYSDIRSRIADPPKWWDEHAVPRYDEFAPHLLANIYATECCLLEIACQDCGQTFHVAMSQDQYGAYSTCTLRALVENKRIHYGDPPNIGCCPSGPTMNCDDLRVLQFWIKPQALPFEWQRILELEVSLGDNQ